MRKRTWMGFAGWPETTIHRDMVSHITAGIPLAICPILTESLCMLFQLPGIASEFDTPVLCSYEEVHSSGSAICLHITFGWNAHIPCGDVVRTRPGTGLPSGEWCWNQCDVQYRRAKPVGNAQRCPGPACGEVYGRS